MTAAHGPREPRELHFYRYHSGATIVLMAGIVGGLLLSPWGMTPALCGFALGAVPTFALVALVLAVVPGTGEALEAFRANVADEEPRP